MGGPRNGAEQQRPGRCQEPPWFPGGRLRRRAERAGPQVRRDRRGPAERAGPGVGHRDVLAGGRARRRVQHLCHRERASDPAHRGINFRLPARGHVLADDMAGSLSLPRAFRRALHQHRRDRDPAGLRGILPGQVRQGPAPRPGELGDARPHPRPAEPAVPAAGHRGGAHVHRGLRGAPPGDHQPDLHRGRDRRHPAGDRAERPAGHLGLRLQAVHQRMAGRQRGRGPGLLERGRAVPQAPGEIAGRDRRRHLRAGPLLLLR